MFLECLAVGTKDSDPACKHRPGLSFVSFGSFFSELLTLPKGQSHS